MIRRHAVVHGEVQGVGFRYNAQAVANKLGVTGFVRNRADGTVETEVEGSAEAVQRMLDWLAGGPTWAEVTAVDVTEKDPIGDTTYDIT
ncbi:MAG: acylphosphatase [Glaciihabitans sp.]|nr:acylphosphatase [Glaciihabitans sp.]